MQITSVLGFDGTPGMCVWLVLLDAAFALSFSRISSSVGFVTPCSNEGRSCSGLEGIVKASHCAFGSELCWKRAATDSKTADGPVRGKKAACARVPIGFLGISKCRSASECFVRCFGFLACSLELYNYRNFDYLLDVTFLDRLEARLNYAPSFCSPASVVFLCTKTTTTKKKNVFLCFCKCPPDVLWEMGPFFL